MPRGNSWRACATGLLAIFAASCSADPSTTTTMPGEEDLTPVVARNLDEMFERVGAEIGVPADLLEAIGYVQTRWQMVETGADGEAGLDTVGLMGVPTADLTRLAELTSVTAEDVRVDPESNIRAGALRLRELADQLGLAPEQRGDLGAWAPAVALYPGIADEEARAAYVLGDVYRVLREGVTEQAESGERIASLAARAVEPDYEYTFPVYAAGTDYSGAVWKPSPNYNARPSGNIGKVAMVIIHTCEGAYSGCVGWLRNTQAGASAHYVVKENGGEVAQLVREANRAWHIAATYKSSLNGGLDSWRNGYSSNHFTVGIEHGGFASQASWPAAQIEASAKLTCDITKRHGIVRDRKHVVGHGQLQPYNRVDPGANWPWSHYMDRVRAICGDGGGGGGGGGATIIVDSNQANNDANVAKIELTGTWTSSNATPGYYGSGYWWAATEPASAPATFWFYLPSAGTRTVDAWWTAGSNRSTAATFVAQNAAGTEVGRATKNQQGSGSQWVTLGTYNFSAGWNKVVLSRWAAEGSVVVADAIRVR